MPKARSCSISSCWADMCWCRVDGMDKRTNNVVDCDDTARRRWRQEPNPYAETVRFQGTAYSNSSTPEARPRNHTWWDNTFRHPFNVLRIYMLS